MPWCRALRRAVAVVGALALPAVGWAQSTVPDNVPMTPPPPAPGTSVALDSARALRGQSLEIAVYTYGPGDEVFERFGHIALAVADARTGEDLAFNWGMFDFNQPNFLGRFLTGDTKYWMAGYSTYAFNAAYQAQNRTIRKQVLNLSPAERGALYDLLSWNAQEQNKFYRYDYYNDNCSTRVRDALDWALGGALRPALDRVSGHHTWRDETARITADNLPVYAGIQIALGRNADAHLTQWQLAFLPEYLARDLAAVPVAGRSLVTTDTVLFTAQRPPMSANAPDRILPALLLGLGLAALVVGVAWLSGAALTLVGLVWYLLGGVLGTALLLAGTVTKHVPYMGSNMSLTALSPLLLLAAVGWVWRRESSRRGRAARGLAAVVAVLAVAGLALMHVPGFYQQSMMVMMTVVPVHVALAALAARGTRPVRTEPVSQVLSS